MVSITAIAEPSKDDLPSLVAEGKDEVKQELETLFYRFGQSLRVGSKNKGAKIDEHAALWAPLAEVDSTFKKQWETFDGSCDRLLQALITARANLFVAASKPLSPDIAMVDGSADADSVIVVDPTSGDIVVEEDAPTDVDGDVDMDGDGDLEVGQSTTISPAGETPNAVVMGGEPNISLPAPSDPAVEGMDMISDVPPRSTLSPEPSSLKELAE